MNNFGTAVVKVVVLAGGAVLGTLLARWCDELLATRSQVQSDYDKIRYEQGLTPIVQEPRIQESQE